MFRELDISLARERNAEMLREVNAYRLGARTRADRGPRTGWGRTVGAFLIRGFAVPSARAVGAATREGVRPKDA